MTAGLYLLLMAVGLLHRKFVSGMNLNRRIGLAILGGGFFLLGLNFVYYYTVQAEKSLEAPDLYKERYGKDSPDATHGQPDSQKAEM